MTHEVHKMLALSTAHVTDETRAILDNDGFNGAGFCTIAFGKGDYGWFVAIEPDPDDEDVGLPDDLKAIFAFARQHGYSWLMFDCDADVIDGLPTFDW